MPRHTPQEKLAILDRQRNVARRYLRGETQWEIARAFEVDQATISRDLTVLQKQWLEASGIDTAERKAQELAHCDEVERVAWAAWTKSQENAETSRAKVRGLGKFDPKTNKEQTSGETLKTSKGQAGDPKFLAIILDCVKRRCEILGLLDPVRAADAPPAEEQISEPERAAIVAAFLLRSGFTGPAAAGPVPPRLEDRRLAGLSGAGPGADLPPGRDGAGPVAGEVAPLD